MKSNTNIDLNKNQKLATLQKDGPVMVVAGPGSGKTTVITYRIKNLIEIHKINPNEILVITYTKLSALEMKNRFLTLINNVHSKVTFSTFHSFFYRIIREHYNYDLSNIIQENEKKDIIKNILKSLKLDLEETEDFIKSVINEISLVKNELIDIEYHNPIDLPVKEFKIIFETYEKWKDQNHKIDFDDMLTKCYYAITNNRFLLHKWRKRYKYIMIDEFQDGATRSYMKSVSII